MNKLTELNSFLFLLLFIGVFATSILLFKVWTIVVPKEYIVFGISIVLIGFLSSYFFWLYIIGYGLNKQFQKYGNNKRFNNYKIVLIVVCITMLISYTGSIYYFIEFGKQPPEYLSIPFAFISLYCIIYIVGHLTNDFKLLDKGTRPLFIDYLVTMILISFFPFGLMILHSHMRLLKREKKKVNNREYKKN